MRRVSLPGSEDFILVAAHLSSRLYKNLESQNTMCIEFANDVRGVEERCGIDRTVVIGDMNTNPFDSGMVAAFGLHGMMSQEQTKKRIRKVGGREYPLFYNPMWSFMGDLSKGPPGTYHYERSEQVNYGWNMFDQVLVRPSMIPRFDFECLEIVTSVGEESLLTKRGIPDKSRSDHLPIVFGIKL
jgi:endonuclease/exonuclease/phosphatase family metal-dependent hydrolase